MPSESDGGSSGQQPPPNQQQQQQQQQQQLGSSRCNCRGHQQGRGNQGGNHCSTAPRFEG